MNAKAIAESLVRVSSGRPDVESLIEQAVSASQGPVSVDGKHNFSVFIRGRCSFES